jgi:hypothetical protein
MIEQATSIYRNARPSPDLIIDAIRKFLTPL